MKLLALISAGIDSPVAAHMMQSKGLEVIGIHFSNEPLSYASPREMTGKICTHLKIKKLYIVKHGFLVQPELMRNCDNSARCVLCRRMMFRISEKIAEKEGCAFLLTGENLGQVASQTLANMTVAAKSIKMQVLRPLLCFDKQQIINIAKEIGTYQLSVEAAACCNAVPKNPITKAVLFRIEAEEKKIDVDKIVSQAVSSAGILDL